MAVNKISLHAIGAANSVNYYNEFVKRYDDPNASILVNQPEAGATNSLMVIDVQDDFILPPPGVGNPYGRFNVEDGINMTDALSAFIVANMSKFTKVILSRDTHTVDHCSFGPNGGPFPNHCIANHVGSKFHPSMLHPKITSENGRKVDVIFKGCTQTTDSFGAVPYYKGSDVSKKAYSERRQLGNCNMTGFTGGKYLKKKMNNFADYPFQDISKYTQVDETQCPEATTEKILAELGADFKIEDLFPKQLSGTHNIFVVGVAGDYCVKDTAINIMNSLGPDQMLNGVKINVYVLQPFVRYGFLPIQFLGGKNVYKNSSVVKLTNFTNTATSDKDINKYLFRYGPGGKKILLSKDEVDSKKSMIEGVIPFIGTNMPEAIASNPETLCSFLSPVKDIINDYRTAGVKMLLSVPDFGTKMNAAIGSIVRGGKRYMKTKKNRSKKNKTRSRR